MSPPLFPVFLKLAGRDVLVVGGGRVAAEKIAALVRAAARVTVVAPAVRPEIRTCPVRIVPRPFRPADIDGHWFVVSAATPSVNRLVARAAARRHVFVNAVDDPAHADAYLGGVLRRDGVTIAISTDGVAPALAGLIREGLDRLLPDDLGRWVARARALRRRQRAEGVPMSARRPALLVALSALYRSRAQGRPS
jgi:uroporphyrin-III C-methyltransferase/precorrin-2 dehydrogenase/sirohydrochlorin ferrochelatase